MKHDRSTGRAHHRITHARSAHPGPVATITAPPMAISAAQELLAHARLFSLLRTLSVRILTDVNVGAIGFSGHSRH